MSRLFIMFVLSACVGASAAAQSGAGNDNQAKGDGVLNSRSVARKAKIKSKPAPDYPEEAVGSNASAVVRLRVVLRASGDVTDAKPSRVALSKGTPPGLADAFIREAVEAAGKIKFEPAMKDGQAVSQYVILEYSFARR